MMVCVLVRGEGDGGCGCEGMKMGGEADDG